jgi:hypothetical protein
VDEVWVVCASQTPSDSRVIDVPRGNNSRLEVGDGLVRKVSRQVYPAEVASRMASALEAYVHALAGEPVRVPALRQVDVLPERGLGFRVHHVVDWCPAPNLTVATGQCRLRAVQDVLRSLADMSTRDSRGTLAVPVDASAQNFHTEPGRVWLVDVFPPLVRHPDGRLPVELLQYGTVGVRRRLAEFAKGTLSGAIVHTLFTAVARGDHPLRQIAASVRGYPAWCYDVLPPQLAGRARDEIRAALQRRLAAHLSRSLVSNAVCVAGQLGRVPAHTSASRTR